MKKIIVGNIISNVIWMVGVLVAVVTAALFINTGEEK